MKHFHLLLLLLMFALLFSACGKKQLEDPILGGLEMELKSNENIVLIETDKGRIIIRFYPDEAPLHTENFIKLSEDKFYDGLTFHRVVTNFVAQGGDPVGDGSGGPGYTIPEEIGHKHYYGGVAMARRGDAINPKRESSGSQFYICLKDLPQLDGAYTVFGEVIYGMQVVENIAVGDVIKSMTVHKGKDVNKLIKE